MKSAFVIPLLLIAIITATLLHANKIRNETDTIDKMALGLHCIDKLLPVNANISVRLLGVPAESWLYCRYLLVPRYFSLERDERSISVGKFDTLLTICNVNTGDSLLHIITTGRKIIWTNADQQYKYYLTCNHP